MTTKVEGNFTTTYVDPAFEPLEPVRLTDEEYSRALQTIVIACVDILFIDETTRRIYLAERIAKPVDGMWWIGGRMRVNERREETAERCVLRETGIHLDPARLVYIGALDFMCGSRQQEPQSMGCHTMSFLYYVKAQPGEMESVSLDPSEYNAAAGLRPFTRAELIAAGVRGNLLEVYDFLFPNV